MEQRSNILKENGEKNVYIFSRSEGTSEKAHMFFVTHLGKVGFATSLFLISLFVIDRESFSLNFIVFSIIFVGLLTYIAIQFHRKFAHKVVIDSRSRKVEFHMYRGEDIIMADIGEIRTKLVPGHVVFSLKDRKILYRRTEDNELVNCLNKLSKPSSVG